MANVNPGPASTSTASATNVLAPATTPNFGNLYQGSNAFRLLAFQKAVNCSAIGDTTLPLINTQAFSFAGYIASATTIYVTNPGAFVNGVFTPGTAAATVLQLFSGPNATGTSITASTTLTGFTGAAAASSILGIVSTGTGFYLASNWGAGAAGSWNLYCHITTPAAATATQFDMYVYGIDFS